MKIKLPDKFIYTDRASRTIAYVERGILYVSSQVKFDDMMYTLAYLDKGYDKCYYCGAMLTNYNRTIDHMFPKCWGGISISPNLVPSCKRCNGRKTNMTYNQYIRWRKYVSQKEKDRYYREAIKKNRKTAYRQGFVLPQSWTTLYDVSNILPNLDFSCIGKKEFNKVESYYSAHGVYPRPIIVSANGWILKGLHIACHAEKHGITKVPAIVLENVEKI